MAASPSTCVTVTSLLEAMTTRQSMLKRAATLENVGRVAAFAASDHARTLTATKLNTTCGTFWD